MSTPYDQRDTDFFEKKASIARKRSQLYKILSEVFYGLTPELVRSLLSREFGRSVLEVMSCSRDCETVFYQSLQEVENYLNQNIGRNQEDILQDLEVEYAQLFIGPGPCRVPIYESLYRDEPKAPGNLKLMMSASALAVKKKYDAAGLALVSGYGDPPDHLATELEFLYFLCLKEEEAWIARNEEEAKSWGKRAYSFINEHIGSWGMHFSRQVMEASKNGFYRGLASLTSMYLQIEGNQCKPA